MSKFKIGLLLGGDYKYLHMQEGMISTLIEQIQNSAKYIGADILATTSRRTPKETEKLLKYRLANNPRCKLLVIANEENKEGVVGGILGLCDIVIVSPESVSMVSEAASSSAYVLVFDGENIQDKRHRLFLKNLSGKGYIQLTNTKDVAECINAFFSKRPDVKVLDDNAVIRKGLERIV